MAATAQVRDHYAGMAREPRPTGETLRLLQVLSNNPDGVTNAQLVRGLGFMRHGAHIHILRKMGYQIASIPMHHHYWMYQLFGYEEPTRGRSVA